MDRNVLWIFVDLRYRSVSYCQKISSPSEEMVIVIGRARILYDQNTGSSEHWIRIERDKWESWLQGFNVMPPNLHSKSIATSLDSPFAISDMFLKIELLGLFHRALSSNVPYHLWR